MACVMVMGGVKMGHKRPIIMSRAGQEKLEIDWAGWVDVDQKSGVLRG